MLIREARPEDLEGLRRLYAQLNPEDPTLEGSRYTSALNKILCSENLYLFVGTADDRIIATCYLNIIPNLSRNASPYGIIENVVIDIEVRNRGYGKALLKHALEYSWSHQCYKVMLQTGSKRKSTHRFYESCGFKANEKFAFVARST